MTRIRSAVLAVALASMPAAAMAGALYQDEVHADSFGNLVIYSAAGYKRIIVGAGEAAAGYNETGSYYESDAPKIAYHRGERLRLRPYRDCEFGAVLLHGRSYMYGLPDNVVPTPADALCR